MATARTATEESSVTGSAAPHAARKPGLISRLFSRRKSAPKVGGLPPWPGADASELSSLFELALAQVADEKDRQQREFIGKMLQEQAQRAWLGSLRSTRAHTRWMLVNWILGGASATASAVGGSVLVAGQLAGPSRWIVGIASLGAGVASGLIAILHPGDEGIGARSRAKRYEDLWRSNWEYAIVTLPTLPESELQAARNELAKRRRQLLEITLAYDVNATAVGHDQKEGRQGANGGP
jgi:hypothetical protein